MSDRIRRITSREVETILRQYGFQLISQKGSHRKWRSEDLGLQVIVPEH
ncbi:MAG: type II toxin-antitoxin system HicA family toxin [Nostoc sp.]